MKKPNARHYMDATDFLLVAVVADTARQALESLSPITASVFDDLLGEAATLRAEAQEDVRIGDVSSAMQFWVKTARTLRRTASIDARAALAMKAIRNEFDLFDPDARKDSVLWRGAEMQTATELLSAVEVINSKALAAMGDALTSAGRH